MTLSWHLAPVLALAASAGCFFGGQAATDGADAGSPRSGSSSGQACGDASTGLPTEVEALLQRRCQSCHGTSLSGSAPMSMVTYDQLVAAAPSDSGQTVAQVSLARMGDAASPMPPSKGPSVPADEIAAFEAWLGAGTPRAEATPCGSSSSGGGSSGFDTPTVCTSDRTWTSRKESADMNPGRACIACHRREEGEDIVSIGGTVYATAHEPDLCYGASTSGAKVVVTGSDGAVLTLPVGPTGNFSQRAGRTKIAFPIRAKVVAADGTEREMSAPQDSGDCNGCHTEQGGEGAPGRIVLP